MLLDSRAADPVSVRAASPSFVAAAFAPRLTAGMTAGFWRARPAAFEFDFAFRLASLNLGMARIAASSAILRTHSSQIQLRT